MAGEQMKTSMGTAAALGCMKMFLMIFNFVFWVTGVALLVLGVWMKVQLYVYFQITTADYSPTVAYAIIGIGAAIIVMGMLGCWCTFKGNSVLLYMYAVFLVLLFVAELSAGISGFVYRKHMEDNMQSGLTNALSESYGPDEDITKAIDNIQQTLKCCGIKNYTDWFVTPWQKGRKNSVPGSCCDPSADKCMSTNLSMDLTNATIYTEGCHRLVVTFIDTNFGIMGSTVIGIAFFMLFGSLLSCCLGKHINKSKYEQVA